MNLTRPLLTSALLMSMAVPALADHSAHGQPPEDADGIRAVLSPATGITGFGRAEYETRTIYAQDPASATEQRFRVHVAQSYAADPTGVAPSTLKMTISAASGDYTCTLPLESIGQRGMRNGGASTAVWVAKYELGVFNIDNGAVYSEQSGGSCVITSNASTWVVPKVAAGDGDLTVTNPAAVTLFTGSF